MQAALEPSVSRSFRENRSLFWFTLFCVFVGPSLGLIVQLPTAASFIHFAFEDMGSATKAAYLMSHSGHLGSDFGYPYGLLTLSLVRVWNAAFGPSIFSYLCLMFVLHLLFGLSFVRFVVFSRISALGVLILLLQMIMMSQIWGVMYALEAILLINALAEIARGRVDIALAFATAAIFVKPSMAYVIGLALVLIAMSGTAASGRWGRLRRLRIAVMVGFALLLCFLCVYGVHSLLYSLSPAAGAALYREYHLGFFRSGRVLWNPAKHNLAYYIGTETGFYLLGVLSLTLFSVALTVRSLSFRNRAIPPLHQCILVTAFCLMCYLLGFFASWYYTFLLSIGLASGITACASADSPFGPRWARNLWIFMIGLLAVTSNYTLLREVIPAWRDTRFPGPAAVYGCAATSQQILEWQKCLADSSAGPRVILSGSAIDVIDPTLDAMPTVFPLRGVVTRNEVDHGASRINAVQYVIVPKDLYPMDNWPEFSAALRNFKLGFDGQFFRLLVRPTLESRRGR